MKDGEALAAASILEHGFVVLPAMFSAEELEKLRGPTVGRLEEVLSILNSRGIELGVGSKAGFREVCLRSPARWDVPCPVDSLPAGLLDGINRITGRVLSSEGDNSGHSIEVAGVVRAEPGCPAQLWHSDSTHQSAEHKPPNMLNVLVSLENVDEVNGPTEVAPGTQRLTNHLQPGKPFGDDIVYQNERNSPELLGASGEIAKATMPAGSVLIFDDRTLHRGGGNKSDRNRDMMFFSMARAGFATSQYYESTRSLQNYDHRSLAAVVRDEFPGLLAQRDAGSNRAGASTLDPVFADGAGGSQVHQSAIEAMVEQMHRGVANIGGYYASSECVGDTVVRARGAMADFLNCEPDEIVFGPSMTALSYHMARALRNTGDIKPGDNVVIDPISHGGNVWTWVQMAKACGAEVRWLPIAPPREGAAYECMIDARAEAMSKVVDKRTKLVTAGAASNGVGTIHDVKQICKHAKDLSDEQALFFVDAVHFAPHALLDVAEIGCDMLACSPYKFYGPHSGTLFARRDLLRTLPVDRLDCQDDGLPREENGYMSRWEIGTQNFEALAGIAAAVDYLASLGPRFGGAQAGASRRDHLEAGYQAIWAHERELKLRFLEGAAQIPGLSLLGVLDTARVDVRMPTFAVSKKGFSGDALSKALCERGVWCTAGNHYAGFWEKCSGGLATNDTGMARISFLHYNTLDEVDRVLDVLKRL